MRLHSISEPTPSIGTHLPQHGGTLAAILAQPDGTPYGLIVADARHEVTGKWGEYKDVPGARGMHGAASTQAMADAGSAIAKAVRTLSIDGHADWYIPSRIELLAAYECAPQLFDKNGWFWSSTQASRYNAWCQDFEYGYSFANSKDNEFRARPVRSIQLQPFNPSPLPACPAFPLIGEADPRGIVEDQPPAPTQAQMAQAFTEWESGYRLEPSTFLAQDEIRAMDVADYGDSCAIYFAGLLRRVQSQPATAAA